MRRSFFVVAVASTCPDVTRLYQRDLRRSYRRLRQAGLYKGEARSLILNVLWSGDVHHRPLVEVTQ